MNTETDFNLALDSPYLMAGALFKYFPLDALGNDELPDSTIDEQCWEGISPDDTMYKLDYSVPSRVGALLMNTLVYTEVSPLNGPIRYGACFSGTLALTGSAATAASAMFLSTALLEGGAAYSSASLLTDRDQDNATTLVKRMLSSKIVKKIIPENIVINKSVEAVVALYLGTSILLSLKHRDDPNLTKADLNKKGLITTAWLAPYCGIQCYLLGKGITSVDDPKVMVPAVIGFGALTSGISWIKRKVLKTPITEESK